MKRTLTTALSLMLAALSSAAASTCGSQSATVASSNHWILLGGSARGVIKQVVAGEFGKDVNSQKRLLGQFDACGDLIIADISYDKSERNVILSMEQHISRVQGGWVAEYDYQVKVLKAGKEVVVDNRQGTINWQKGQHGNITSASDKFTSMGTRGFTNTTYRYDRRLRLEKSVVRGSDPLTNGENHYHWNAQGLMIRTTSTRSTDSYIYNPQWREVRLNGTATTPLSTIRTVDECQSWDEVGNCTLSYRRETEIFTRVTIDRHLSSAYKYEYWDQPAAAEE